MANAHFIYIIFLLIYCIILYIYIYMKFIDYYFISLNNESNNRIEKYLGSFYNEQLYI